MATVTGLATAADTVSLSVYARPAHEVLSDVSKQLGMKLEADHGLRHLPLFIEVKDMPGKTFLERLPKIADAEWQRHDDRLVLTRGLNRVRAAIDVEAKDRTPRVAEAIRKYLEQNRALEDWSDAALNEKIKREMEMRERLTRDLGTRGGFVQTLSTNAASPASAVLHEALRRIPAATFASILPGQKLVLSSTPNTLQRPLGYNATPSINQFMSIQRRVNAALQAGGSNPNQRVSTDLSSGQETQVVELIVTLQRMAQGEGISVAAFLVGPTGDVVAQPRAWIEPTPIGAGTAPAGTDHSIELSKEASTLLQVLRGTTQASQGNEIRMVFATAGGPSTVLGGESRRLPVPDDLAEKMKKPTEHDPLSFVVADVLKGLAEKTGRPLMATVPDSMLGTFAQTVSGTSINTKVLWTLARLGLQIAADEQGWLIHPRLFAEADRQRVNRADLEQLVRSNSRLDDTVRYATVMSQGWSQASLDFQWIRALAFPAFQQLNNEQRRPYLKIFGHLPANSRRPLLGQTGEYFVNQLPVAARQIAIDTILSTGGMMMFGQGMMAVTMEVSTDRRNAVPQIMVMEPTEAFPTGIDATAKLNITSNTESALYAIDANGLGEFVTPSDLGFRSGVPSGTPGFSAPSFKEYQLADIERINLQLIVRNSPRGQATLDDPRVRTPQVKVTLDTMPSDMKDRYERAKKQGSEMQFGGFRGAPPPNRPPSP